ncbi:hypothetical protein [Sphingobacterium paludis]|uniref:Uncharacterized protein n=1 Tax=Sphingobacterium paludis TaxID=1476465 RepID=A0A4R7CZ00_9SPHI|nr:hypothetical protein [Sphingobacterium paludis]TDS13167.1 hypothetical protein B0I21_105301 [Sphingobacterium paludis]
MQLVLQLKRLGKKRIISIPYTLQVAPRTLTELIKACVEAEVERYNGRREEVQLLTFLTPQEIQDQAKDGKIGFGDIENMQLAAVATALDTAFLAHRDGLFAVFIDEIEVKALDMPIQLRENAEVAFVRLTFLAGRLR